MNVMRQLNNEDKEFYKDIDIIPALLTRKEKICLIKISKKCEGNAIEIGSWLGGSTILISKNLKKGKKLYAIDPHKKDPLHNKWGIINTYSIFKNNIKRYKLNHVVKPIKMTSSDARKIWHHGKVDLIFIDGDHTYKGVKNDYNLWKNILTPYGKIAFHDFISLKDITKFVIELLNENKIIELKGSIIILQKGKTTILQKIKLHIYIKYRLRGYIISKIKRIIKKNILL